LLALSGLIVVIRIVFDKKLSKKNRK